MSARATVPGWKLQGGKLPKPLLPEFLVPDKPPADPREGLGLVGREGLEAGAGDDPGRGDVQPLSRESQQSGNDHVIVRRGDADGIAVDIQHRPRRAGRDGRQHLELRHEQHVSAGDNLRRFERIRVRPEIE